MALKVQPRNPPPVELGGELSGTVQAYLGIASRGEDVRRRDDRIGARLFHGQHWVGVRQYRDRAAITANVAHALVSHKVAIIAKHQPIPVVEAREPGSQEAAERMRQALIYKFEDDDMLLKGRAALLICNITRTCAGKVVWDQTLNGGIGDVTTDIIFPWDLILDGRVSDYSRMQFCGDKARMFRARAISLYPHAAKEIVAASPTSAGRPGSPTSEQGMPVRDAWGGGQSLVRGEPTSINSKAVFTAYAGDPGFAKDKDDIVEVSEVYHIDLSTYEDEEPDTDEFGNELHELVLDEEGMPQFEEVAPETLPDEDGSSVPVPAFRLMKQRTMRLVHKRKYPQWRRTTTLNPGMLTIEDIAWDGPLPYFFVGDTFALTGLWQRGSILQLETLQAMLNVGLSIMTDNLRMGSVQAFFAATQAGLGKKILMPGPGQVVETGNLNPREAIMPLDIPKLDQNWFQYINSLISLMEKVIGAEGVMQGSAKEAPRTDSAKGFDSLAEIGGSRLTDAADRYTEALKDWARITGWFIQNYYTQRHAIAVQDNLGNVTWEQAWGQLVAGELTYGLQAGSSVAWSESARFERNFALLQAGVIDRIEFYKRTNFPNWREMYKRMLSAIGTPAQALMTAQQPKPSKQKAPTGNGRAKAGK